MNNPHKAFLETCSAAIGATGLHPRERLTFLVIAWLCDNGDYVPRKAICEHTGISSKNISTVLSSLKEKGLVQLKVGAKPSVAIQHDFTKCLNNEGANALIKEASLNNEGKEDESALIKKANLHNEGDSTGQQQEVCSPPQCPPSSSPPNPLNNNPPFIPPTHVTCACEDAFDEWWANY